MKYFLESSAVWQALFATLFTYGVTAAGASVVFFFRSVNKKLMDVMMGGAAGVMIAASYWSLLEPAISQASQAGENAPLIVGAGFLMGGLFITASDLVLERKSRRNQRGAGWKRCVLLTAAVTLHNIPEGLAVGVAFGYAHLYGAGAELLAAVLLALGIGIQNFPEGLCVAMPLRREGASRRKSFLAGQFSGMVEPPAGIIGALFALHVHEALPFVLSFSAGAMISVVCSELIPESFHDNKHLASLGVLTGFITMMVLDVALG